jgi:8-oxo-dGTP pyrophosphatase MutT (NUDIX family)
LVLQFSPKRKCFSSSVRRLSFTSRELPSGKVESEDPTLLDAATRECFEETGMTVTEFLEEANSFEHMVKGRGLTL